jgi:hypothetical protein
MSEFVFLYGRERPSGSPERIDGPFPEAKDVVGGYTLVQARDLGHAVERTSSCPILDIGSLVDVPAVMKLG